MTEERARLRLPRVCDSCDPFKILGEFLREKLLMITA
jgi:hypothetical protein